MNEDELRSINETEDESERVRSFFGDPIPCDFCQRLFPYLNPINDGLWAICDSCMDREYGGEEE